eukprot:TRINITY_DN9337_c0_g1_i1.p1 TRINITY_DN9337_c0_g1~~TRINITY_DN9337_c0_g1_i1.p1  ORF type:complete len:169 (+),score=25.57 TRINITY_DN9337_c0_g1_i1:131-637(+)
MPRAHWILIIWAFIGSFAGIITLATLHQFVFMEHTDRPLLIGSFGASAVLLYAAPASPLAQPRNLIGGHIISSIIGIICCYAMRTASLYWIRTTLAVSISIVVMDLTKTLHPPAGGTALIIASDLKTFEQFGFMYVVIPVILGNVLMLLVALIVMNIAQARRYPEYWI